MMRMEDSFNNLSSVTFPAPGDDDYHDHKENETHDLTAWPSQSSSVLVGRDRERSLLLKCWNRASSQSSVTGASFTSSESATVVVIHGESGVGKSSIMETMREHVVNDGSDAIFVSGKFDQLASQKEPFHAIVEAMSDICDVLAIQSNRDQQDLGGRIRDQMSADELALFSQLLPSELNQRFLCGSETTQRPFRSSLEQNPAYSSESFGRLQGSCSTFLKAVSQYRPLLFFIDDMQWADEESTRLIHALSQSKSRHMMLVLAFRDDSLDTHHVRNFFGIDEMKRNCPNVTDIELRNLDVEAVHSLISSLGMHDHDPDRQRQLAVSRLVHGKTKGNPLFVWQLLHIFKLRRLLTFAKEENKWNWAALEELARVDVSDGVNSSIEARVYQLRPKVRTFLVMAAHLGFSFRRDLLVAVSKPAINPERDNELENALVEAEKCSLIVSGSDRNRFYFMHDNVQECFYNMVSDGMLKERMSLTIGRSLLKEVPDLIRTDPSVLFLVVDNLNSGLMHIDEQAEKLELMELNHEAAKQSFSRSSFATSINYLRCAIDLLSDFDMWQAHYGVSLELHNLLAQATCNSRKYDDCRITVTEVSAHARTVLDKQVSLHVFICSLGLQGKNEEALNATLKGIAELGMIIPTHPPKTLILSHILRLKWMMRHLHPDDLGRLPKMEDRRIMAIQALLQSVSLFSNFISRYSNLLVFSSLKIFLLSLKHGLSEYTTAAIAIYAIIESRLCVEYGVALGRESLRLSSGNQREFACASVACHAGLIPWREPLRNSIPALKLGVEAGMEAGDIYMAHCNLNVLICTLFLSGMPLQQAERQIRSYCERMSMEGVNNALWNIARCCWQTSLNLIGRSQDPLLLNGEALVETEIQEWTDQHSIAKMRLFKAILACYFRSTSDDSELLNSLLAVEVNLQSVWSVVSYHFFCCLMALDLVYRGVERRKNQARAKRSLNVLKKRVQKRCVFTQSVLPILEAEMKTVCHGVVDINLYEKGIRVAMRDGYRNFASLACDRAGFAVLNNGRSRDEARAKDFFEEGLQITEEWEAMAKVEWMFDSKMLQRPQPNKREKKPSSVQFLHMVEEIEIETGVSIP